MLNDLIVLLDHYPGALFIILMVSGAIGMGVERLVESQKEAERKAYWRGRQQGGGQVVSFRNGKAKDRQSSSVSEKPGVRCR